MHIFQYFIIFFSGEIIFWANRSIYKLQYLIYESKNKLSAKHYNNLRDFVDEKKYHNLKNSTENELVNKLNDLLHNSVQSHMLSDSPLGVMFSAGLDSSLIASIALQYKKTELFHLSCIADKTQRYVKDFEKQFGNKINIINESTDNKNVFLGMPKLNYHYETPNKEEGTSLSYICEMAREMGFKVLLTGDGSDELFGGYRHHLEFLTANKLNNSKIKKWINRINYHFPSNYMNTPNTNPNSYYYNTFPPDQSLNETPLNFLLHNGERLKDWNNCIQNYNFVQNQNERYFQAYMFDEFNFRFQRYLTRADRYSMMSSIELRNPLLHSSIIKFALNLPLEFKIKKKFHLGNYSQKYILRKVAKLNGVPKSIIERYKQGTPVRMKSNYLDKIINAQNFFGLSNILKLPEDTIKYSLLNTHSNNTRIKISFLSTEYIYKMFIERKSHLELKDDIYRVLHHT